MSLTIALSIAALALVVIVWGALKAARHAASGPRPGNAGGVANQGCYRAAGAVVADGGSAACVADGGGAGCS